LDAAFAQQFPIAHGSLPEAYGSWANAHDVAVYDEQVIEPCRLAIV
jgi:hypothetical protein